jgi:cytosine/uracil/thiamine/allantoin permease
MFWNPPELIMAITDGDGKGSRIEEFDSCDFFLSLGGTLSSQSTYVGGIDRVAGIFPLYINARRGTRTTVTFACLPTLAARYSCDRPDRFFSALSAFSVFLAPVRDVMAADVYFVRKM